MTGTMLDALTVTQPWVSLIAAGAKRFECRGWPPPRRLIGRRLAIHAGKAALPRGLSLDDIAAIEAGLALPKRRWHELPFGAVICFVTVEGAYQVGASKPTSRRVPVIRAMPGSVAVPETGLDLRWNEWRLLDIDEGKWLWQLGSVEPLPSPIPAIGQQGVWRWCADTTSLDEPTSK